MNLFFVFVRNRGLFIMITVIKESWCINHGNNLIVCVNKGIACEKNYEIKFQMGLSFN